MRKQTIATLTASLMLALSLGVGGCGNSANQKSSASAASGQQSVAATSADGQAQQPGEQVSGAMTLGEDVSVTFTNGTGLDLKSVAFRASGTSEYDADHTFEVKDMKDGSITTLKFKQFLSNGSPVKEYDILAKTTDDSNIEVFGVNLLDAKDLVLKFEDSFGYVEYRVEGSDEVVNNREQSEERLIQEMEGQEEEPTYDMQNQYG